MSDEHGMRDLNGIEAFCLASHKRSRGDSFGRMFDLAPLGTLPSFLKKLGAQKNDNQDGPMNGGDRSERTDTVAVGDIFFGQFIDHDITLDVSTSLSATARVNQLSNTRTPSLDLDNIYGKGPEAQPYLYSSEGEFKSVKLLTGADLPNGTDLEKNDLLRSPHGRAIIGDPRNDENGVISQLQLAMIRFHNHVVDEVSGKYKGKKLFEESRRLATWHYQWIVVHDYLVKICGGAVVNNILGCGRQFYSADMGDAFIPVEFSVAAYRFGHSMIPQKIQIQKNGSSLELFGRILRRGFKPLTDEKGIVDWLELVDSDAGRQVQMADKLDTKLAKVLLKLPFIEPSDDQSLASRNLLRGQTFLLPSGEKIAEKMKRDDSEVTAVSQAAQNIAGNEIDLSTGTPLWFYILTEAEVLGRETRPNQFDPGEGLGPVGATIVAETLIGLIELDPTSYLAVNRNWEPEDDLKISKLSEMLTFT